MIELKFLVMQYKYSGYLCSLR